MRVFLLPLMALLSCGFFVTPANAQDAAELAKQAKVLLEQHCFRCHGRNGSIEGEISYILNRTRLVDEKIIVPFKPDESELYKKIVSGKMPKEVDIAEKPPLKLPPFPPEGKDVIKKWIAAGAPDFNPPAPKRVFISNSDVLKFILDDLEKKVAERDRKFVRYFTVTHLYNVDQSDDELLSYRVGLSKLLNSLSWNRKITKPVPIDPAQTIFRIDLRDFDWDEREWDAILHANPYGVAYKEAAATKVSAYTQTNLPFVRADWFVFAASRPPLYHDLLRLPTNVGELEKKLEIDVLKNIKSERVWRAGFNGSKVSQNNRLIERHQSPHGAYWKSYDFSANVGRKDLFKHPLGPGADKQFFQHDGGEIIFNLPNGLQAYLLVNAEGKRIDKGPLEIVSDKEQRDRAVVNGISCMHCHVEGMISKDDQVRPRVVANRKAFEEYEYELLLALYPEKGEFDKKMDEDKKRFHDAVERTGSRVSQSEPVFILARRFENPVNLNLAAAEIGLTAEELKSGLDSSPKLAREIGELKVGVVNRDKFVKAFGLIVEELGVGKFVAPDPVKGPQRGGGKPKVGDRVEVTALATGFEDVSGKQSELVASVQKGAKGKVIKIDESRELCQLRLDKPAGIEVWVDLKKVKTTEE